MPHNILTCSDAELIADMKNAVVTERDATVALIALLAEFDARRLCLAAGCSSTFTYCTQVLRLSEHAAYGRIAAARASRRWPTMLQLLTTGEINLTTIVLLAPHLTDENHDALLDASRGKSKPEIQQLIAASHPQPDIDACIRRLPVRVAVSPSTANPDPPRAAWLDAPSVATSQAPLKPPRPVVAPLAPERYVIKVTVSAEAHSNLKRAQDLLRHTMPTGDPAAIVERALAALVAELDKTRHAAVRRPRARPVMSSSSSRHVPARVKRAVWARDQGRCAFVGSRGRCAETGFLEFHHVVPFAAGGATNTDNLQLRCRAHNAYEAGLYFGDGLAIASGPP